MKHFIITVDTEGDNLWMWHTGDDITTENAKSIPRFQNLCEKYGLIPTYLTNYEMACDDRWVTYGAAKREKENAKLECIFMHGILRLNLRWKIDTAGIRTLQSIQKKLRQKRCRN